MIPAGPVAPSSYFAAALAPFETFIGDPSRAFLICIWSGVVGATAPLPEVVPVELGVETPAALFFARFSLADLPAEAALSEGVPWAWAKPETTRIALQAIAASVV